jgi:hypothetical protein
MIMLTYEALTIIFSIVYLVIFHLKRKLPLGEFFRLINNKPLACNLLQVYCKEQDRELLKDFYYQDDRRIESANLSLEESFGETVCYWK